MEKFRTPILTIIFNVTGVITLIGTGLMMLVFQAFKGGFAPGILTVAGGVLSALIQFGFAQVIEYVGLIAYNTTPPRSAESERIVPDASEKPAEPYRIPGL